MSNRPMRNHLQSWRVLWLEFSDGHHQFHTSQRPQGYTMVKDLSMNDSHRIWTSFTSTHDTHLQLSDVWQVEAERSHPNWTRARNRRPCARLIYQMCYSVWADCFLSLSFLWKVVCLMSWRWLSAGIVSDGVIGNSIERGEEILIDR